MRHEESLRLEGEGIFLVPYKTEHVPKYHKWMGDNEILRLTGSERLTLEEEFEMQKSWAEDPDKCTFIILDRLTYKQTGDEIESMLGDTNLFFNNQEDLHTAEIEIMIAEISARRKGFANEALKLMMNFGNEKLSLEKFIAKIKDDNDSSIRLFNKLGFEYVSKSEVFHEVTLSYKCCNSSK